MRMALRLGLTLNVCYTDIMSFLAQHTVFFIRIRPEASARL
jgi:hypothetical protein